MRAVGAIFLAVVRQLPAAFHAEGLTNVFQSGLTLRADQAAGRLHRPVAHRTSAREKQICQREQASPFSSRILLSRLVYRFASLSLAIISPTTCLFPKMVTQSLARVTPV